MNKVLQGLYPPGSTVKPMNALALLRAGSIPRRRSIAAARCSVGNRAFHCHKRGGHGARRHASARIAQSCDIYFYEMVRASGL
jgi:penicillin-binding protein 2